MKSIKEYVCVDESMRFPKRDFLIELSQLMEKYRVTIDAEKAVILDKYGKTIVDLSDQQISPDDMHVVAFTTTKYE